MESAMSSDDLEDFPGRLLHQAALWDNSELLEDLLHSDQSHHINGVDAWGRTPLHAAATTEDSQCLRILLQSGADPDIRCGPRGESRTPLHVCAEHGYTGNIQLLLSYDARVDMKDAIGLTALDLATRGGHIGCVQALLTAQAAQEASRLSLYNKLTEVCLRGDSEMLVKLLACEEKSDPKLVLNMSIEGSNTLLFKAAQLGHRDVVQVLLKYGAEPHVNPVTKYSPLYIACFEGHKDVVELLLKKFPELVQYPTVEKWLPSHACCLQGHHQILDLLLKFNYPASILKKYKDKSGLFELDMPFDVNAKDVSGQTVLYIASYMQHAKIVDLLLRYRVKAKLINKLSSVDSSSISDAAPAKKRISNSIHALMMRLNVSLKSDATTDGPDYVQQSTSPVDIDTYCDHETQTALHAAVKAKNMHIASLLLSAGANPNLNIYLTDEEVTKISVCSSASRDQYVFTGSSALVEAVRQRDTGMIDLLLKYGARDPDSKALFVAVVEKDDNIVSKLLTLKAHIDRESNVNRKGGVMMDGRTSFTPLAQLLPTNPVILNWHGHQCLEYIRTDWLSDAVESLNPKSRLHHLARNTSLHAITRIDVSNNVIVALPACIFQLQSLRYLNCAQNKLEHLPQGPYYAPVLDEVLLQDNRLDFLPEAMFKLPSLCVLDVSNNKLQSLPRELWTAPKLKEFNASFNLLCELPCHFSNASQPSTPRTSESSLSSVSDCFVSAPWEVDSAYSKRSVELDNFGISRQQLVHNTFWRSQVHVNESIIAEEDSELQSSTQLTQLNLAHNNFSEMPSSLACLAFSLTRLNLSFNNLKEIGPLCSYPHNLRQLDLSHNKIEDWRLGSNLPGLEDSASSTGSQTVAFQCYAPQERSLMKVQFAQGLKIHRISQCSSCLHRRHRRLENLRTLNLADNLLSNIGIWGEDAGDDEGESKSVPKSKLMFPNLNSLDVSNNRIKTIPSAINELNQLSVFNISGNSEITELPPEMGLLSKLWNLNTRGCNLQEPLRSMIESKKYKTMDVVGYLKSILQDARPYARMKLMLVGTQGIGKTSLLEQLRHEGTGSYKRKPPEHWAKRMSNRSVHVRSPRGLNLSTVGVDIGDWTYEKKTKGNKSFGPITFRTWDFAGQKEYYTTHQYFLSKRSLYLVLWRITDGRKAIDEIFHWLVNIQARAPNSPVIIVGTHYDVVKDSGTQKHSEELQQVIRDRFIHIVDAEKCGLPRVLDSIEISCRTKYNIRNLCNIIYDSVFNLKLPGGKERLLEQRIPATYLALEDVVTILAADLKAKGQDPVMSSDEFSNSVTSLMQTRFRMSFRDRSELGQATAFLHENGVMLHYEDATLKDLYFLDPQWLCDMLAHIVTVREINPFAPHGIMKIEDIQFIFRASGSASLESQGYVLNLLNKFEVAVTWDSRTLLIPSLLPTEEQTCQGLIGGDARVKIPVRSRGRVARTKRGQKVNRAVSMPSRPVAQAANTNVISCPDSDYENEKFDIRYQMDFETAIFRIVLLSYVPVGFWSRIITRLLAEDAIVDILRSYFNLPVSMDADLGQFLEWKAEWRCWQTGIELQYLGATVLRIKEVAHSVGVSPFNQRDLRFVTKLDGQWCDLDTTSNAMLEIFLPNETIAIRKSLFGSSGVYADGDLPAPGYQTYALEPSVESITKLLTIAVDHIDTLLEDWYPSLGTRFVHTSEGKYLVTRLVPCPLCINSTQNPAANGEGRASDLRKQQIVPSASSVKSTSSVDWEKPRTYVFTIEECIVQTHANRHVNCPRHGDVHLAQMAPDTLFLDIGERNIIHGQNLKLSSLLGRGAFGFVYKASIILKGNPNAEVAVKMLQPVDPGPDARKSAQQLYNVAAGQWQKDPLQYACKAYCTARQELSILLTLRHTNIVPLVGLCTEPRALVLELAPLGALDAHLKDYRRSGAKLSLNSTQQIVSQIAKAVEYLHQKRIIYRDLKSENVLVWSLPRPNQRPECWRVDVKLADYGISRLALPTGNKGFGGTEGFMAPEIVRFNGEEEYTEKVDCFSFGMFLYELVTCRQPFEGHESVKEYLLDGGRPAITPHEAMFPVYLLDLMALCWSQHPKDRPTASQIVSIATAPEFVHLLDVISLNHDGFVTDGLAVPISSKEMLHELWLCSTACQIDLLLASFDGPHSANELGNFVDYHSLQTDIDQPITAACLVGDAIWLGDARGQIFCFSNKTYQCLFRYALEPDAPNGAAIRRLINIPSLRRVAVALANGRLFLCRNDFIPLTSTQGEGTFVMTELGLGGAGAPLHCLAAIFFTVKESVELWCGQSHGNICIFTLTDGAVKNQEIVNHYDPALPGLEVLQMVACDNIPTENYREEFDTSYECKNSDLTPIQGPTVWSYVYPGSVVYQWNVTTRRILHRLDCSKLVPCSESLQSISIEEHLSPGKCQVTSLALLGQELFIGTNWGCIIVVVASSLRPVTVFRPYEEEVRLILPFVSCTSGKKSSLLATIGKGYRNLLPRYGCQTAGQASDRLASCIGERKTKMEVLLWRTEQWY